MADPQPHNINQHPQPVTKNNPLWRRLALILTTVEVFLAALGFGLVVILTHQAVNTSTQPEDQVAQPGKGLPNPAPNNTEGQVKTADPSGLVKIMVGSDAGLRGGHTLAVYRTKNGKPAKYLGTIRIIEVNRTEGVGQPVGKLHGAIQPGDLAISRILGN
jgi:hypothetical protein